MCAVRCALAVEDIAGTFFESSATYSCVEESVDKSDCTTDKNDVENWDQGRVAKKLPSGLTDWKEGKNYISSQTEDFSDYLCQKYRNEPLPALGAQESKAVAFVDGKRWNEIQADKEESLDVQKFICLETTEEKMHFVVDSHSMSGRFGTRFCAYKCTQSDKVDWCDPSQFDAQQDKMATWAGPFTTLKPEVGGLPVKTLEYSYKLLAD
ncbi:hypothetical protein HELRODRAFT_165298 [Helobdella robusta]|uniref:Uncharacterized protein n=1 Tax=Helobdella robusta TaxID=6412 RepID=T1EWK0_HELRO|nr:hypothetical protein HELRODRAFT_165298 [Helobdella robusta]ESN91293.1 hypothetical protein HELRODRAFT_165298 [Helobdella robusta]